MRDIGSLTRLEGTIAAPPSKSVTQRALVAASLARGVSTLRRPLLGGDGRILVEALRRAGLQIDEQPEALTLDGSAGISSGPPLALHLGNAGTAMRFLAARLATGERECVLDGDPRMRERPIEPLLAALRALGARAASLQGNGCPPVAVGGLRPAGGEAHLDGTLSSQFLSGLLMAGPGFENGVAITVEGALVSRPYVDVTCDVMRHFGVEATRFAVAPGSRYRPADITIEGDWSSASYFLAAAAIVPGRVEMQGLRSDSAQGDRRFADLLEEAGCRIERRADGITATGTGTLQSLDADLGDCPDIAPTAAIVALFARGTTRLRGLAHLRLKESDRIAALCEGIAAIGGDARPEADGLTIRPRPPHGGIVDPRGDHRMAFAFALLGLVVPGVLVRDPDCVAKSWSSFWSDLEGLGAVLVRA